jgi:hypothetical protein
MYDSQSDPFAVFSGIAQPGNVGVMRQHIDDLSKKIRRIDDMAKATRLALGERQELRSLLAIIEVDLAELRDRIS